MMVLRSIKIGVYTLMLTALSGDMARAWEPSEGLRVESLPGVRLIVEQGLDGSETVRVRVGTDERAFRVETLAEDVALYQWIDSANLVEEEGGGDQPDSNWERATAPGAHGLGEIYASLHPWDGVFLGERQVSMVLRMGTRLLVAAEEPQEAVWDPLTELVDKAPPRQARAWAELLRSAGLGGVYVGNIPLRHQGPGYRWIGVVDADAIQGYHVVSGAELLESLRGADWERMKDKALPLPLIQYLAVARAQEAGAGESAVLAALPRGAFGWFLDAVAGDGPLETDAREALWEAVPPTPGTWRAWGIDARRAICEVTEEVYASPSRVASLCDRFKKRMCTPAASDE